mmetsp:Transcript_81834/g.231958  ORF Transcript_81834/g.231958 Transcript_81834/m.231958 type:complete len:92 (-) Transcript_81834:240-515(-)
MQCNGMVPIRQPTSAPAVRTAAEACAKMSDAAWAWWATLLAAILVLLPAVILLRFLYVHGCCRRFCPSNARGAKLKSEERAGDDDERAGKP